MTSVFINDRLNDFNLDAALLQLSEQRRATALKFKHEFGRRACVAAYLLLCEGLHRLYGLTEKPVFDYGEHGKPFIIGHPDIHFNLSHCQEAAICAISDSPVGIDIESVRSYKEGVVRYTMSDSEVQQIEQSPRPEVMFTRLWTMKEAVLKLSGHGISNDMKHVLDNNMSGLITVEGPDMRYIYSIASPR